MSRWFERIFLIPFVAIGICTIVLAYYSWAMLCFPTTTSGVITEHSKSWDSEDQKELYFLHYAFERNGAREKGSSCISREHYDTIKDGSPCQVFYTKMVPNGGAELDIPERHQMGWFFAPFITFFAVFWNLITWTALVLSFSRTGSAGASWSYSS